MTTTTSTKTPPPPAYDAVAAISSKTTTTTTTTPDEFAKTNRITKDDTADYDDVDSLASLTTRELHRIAISNGDRLGEGPKESTTGGGGGGGGGAAAAGNFETNEGGVGLSEAEEKDAKIALCEVRNPKKIGQGNATTTTKKKITTTTTTIVFLSSVKRHVLRASVFDFDATLCGLLLLLLLLLTNNCVLLLLLLNRLNRVRGVYRQIGMYVSLVQQSERGSRTTIL